MVPSRRLLSASVSAALAVVPAPAVQRALVAGPCVGLLVYHVTLSALQLVERRRSRFVRYAALQRQRYRALLEECSVLVPYQLPAALEALEAEEAEGAAPPLGARVMDAVRDLNTAKTALRKMLGLLQAEGVAPEARERYARVIESTILVDEPAADAPP